MLILPTMDARAWRTAAAFNPALNGATPNSYTEVVTLNSSVFTALQGSVLRVSLSSSAGGGTIHAAFGRLIGSYSFDGTQVQATYLGSAAIVIPSNSTIVLDDILYPFNSSNNYAFCYYSNSVNTKYGAQSGCNIYTKYGSDVMTTSKSGYSAYAGNPAVELITKIEVFG